MDAVRTAAVRRPGPCDRWATRAVRGESRGSPEVGWRGTTLWEAAKDDERRDDERRMEENIIMNVRVEP